MASKDGINVPTGLDVKSKATEARLSRLHGAAFDRAYMQDMVTDHEQDIAEFRQQAGHGTNPDIRAFASKTLPTLEEHLKMAQTTLAAVKTSGQ